MVSTMPDAITPMLDPYSIKQAYFSHIFNLNFNNYSFHASLTATDTRSIISTIPCPKLHAAFPGRGPCTSPTAVATVVDIFVT